MKPYDSGKLTNIKYYLVVNKLVVDIFVAASNKKVTATEFICMLPQMVSSGRGKCTIKKWDFMQRKEKRRSIAFLSGNCGQTERWEHDILPAVGAWVKKAGSWVVCREPARVMQGELNPNPNFLFAAAVSDAGRALRGNVS